MQYIFNSISLVEDKNGGQYVSTLASLAGDPNDRGFKLPFFNPQIINAVIAAKAKGENPSFTLDAEIEEETVQLGAVYFRRASDANGKLLDTPAIDTATNKPALYRKIRVHTIFQYSMHDAFYVEGERKGMRIMEDVYENGQKVSRPAKAFDLDDFGRPIRKYMNGWAPEERKNQILKTFFILAPQEYQDAAVATEAPTQQQQTAQSEPSLQNAAEGLFGGQAQQQQQASAANEVNPLAQ